MYANIGKKHELATIRRVYVKVAFLDIFFGAVSLVVKKFTSDLPLLIEFDRYPV